MQTRSDGDAAQLERTVELAKDVGLLYKTASVTDKRALLKSLLSNFTVSEKNVEITLAIPFQMIADRKHGASCGHHRGTCRTWTQILRNLYEKMSVVPNG